MNLVINQTSKVEFGISVAGTQTKPSEVRVVLGDGARLVFKAITQDGINYSALVTPIKEVVGSICRLTIEVLFGEKVFVPINRMISIADTEPTLVPPAPDIVEPPEHVPPPIETVANTLPPEEEITRPPEVEPQHVIEVPAKIEEPVQLKKNAPIEVKHVNEAVKNPIPSLFFELTATPPPPKPVIVEEVVKPVIKKKRKPLPKLNDKKPSGIEVNTLKVTKSIFTEEIKQPTPKSKVVVEQLEEQEVSIPIIIKREDIVYI